MRLSRRRSLALIGVLVVPGWLVVSGIGGRFDPQPPQTPSFLARAQTKEAHGLRVSAAALNPAESRQMFGVRLARQNVQPLWLKVENGTDEIIWFLPAATDPSYFSPLEVAYRFHHWARPARDQAIDAWFIARHMPVSIQAHATASGYVFTNLDTGLKAASVLLVGAGQAETFTFALDVPGGKFRGTHVTFDALYPNEPIENLDLEALRQKLAGLPCCTVNARGSRQGDPLNLVVVEAAAGDPLRPFVQQRWHLTEILDWRSAFETMQSFLFGKAYQSSPVSALYLFGRREDTALQKIRTSISRRNHLRLWLAPFTYGGRRVWVGQISQDIGVRLTDATWYLTTHKIGPDVDFDRDYILQDLVLSGSVERFGYVGGVGAASAAARRRNLTGDPYFTDGRRLVVFLSDAPTAPQSVVSLPWARAPGN
jgi:hypothetical protein